jgi:hypothetical protein
MINENSIPRRIAVKSSIFGLLAVSFPNVLFAKKVHPLKGSEKSEVNTNNRYPSIDELVVAEVVGVAHFNLDRLKVLVNHRPELARATWDWGFGDWETAIGAASHVGRKDIVTYLLSMGARPDIFTFAMLGAYEIVKSMIEFSPGLQVISGPHGISLLQHAKNGISANSSNTTESYKLVDYLTSLGNADSQKYFVVEENDKQKYLGDYKYGDGELEGFSIKLNMKKLISLGKIGKFGGALLKTGENRFTYNGTPSIEISFQIENERVMSLTIHEPDLILIAKKI